MRSLVVFVGAFTFPIMAVAQTRPERFIEVQVTDTAQLPFAGLDYEVRMPSPFDLAAVSMPEGDINEKARDRALDEGAAQARASEDQFLSILTGGNFTHRLTSTEHTEDYMYGTDRTYDVNTYVVELKDKEAVERIFAAVYGISEYVGNVTAQHFGTRASIAPHLMRKHHDQARIEAEALVEVAGGRLGQLISAQELAHDEGSLLEQLFLMDKRYGDGQEAAQKMGSVQTTTMASGSSCWTHSDHSTTPCLVQNYLRHIFTPQPEHGP